MKYNRGELTTIIAVITTVSLGLIAVVSSYLVNTNKYTIPNTKAACYIDRACILEGGTREQCQNCFESEELVTSLETDIITPQIPENSIDELPTEPLPELLLPEVVTPVMDSSQSVTAPNPCPQEGTYYNYTSGSCLTIEEKPLALPTPSPASFPWDNGWDWSKGNPLQWIGDRLGDLGGLKDNVIGNNTVNRPQSGSDLPSGIHPTVIPIPTIVKTVEKPWWETFGNIFNQNTPTPTLISSGSSVNLTDKDTKNTNADSVDNRSKKLIDKTQPYETKIESTAEYDMNGVPTKIITLKGEEITLDNKTRDRIVQYRNNVVDYKEPEILMTRKVQIVSPEKPIENPLQHPILKELPKDVLSNDELQKRGINIYQANTSNLYIRESAFEEDGPLATFAKYKEKYPDAELNIVLLDSPDAYSGEISDDRIPSNILERIKRDKIITKQQIEDERSRLIKTRSLSLEEARNKYKEAIDNNEKDLISRYASLIIDEKIVIEELKNKTDYEIRADLLKSKKNIASGVFYTGLGTAKNAATIVLGVKDVPNRSTTTIVRINPDGKINDYQETWTSTNFFQSSISSSLSRPNPESFRLNPAANPNDPASYPYGIQNIGQALRHEIAHFDLSHYRMSLWLDEYSNWMRENLGKPEDQRSPKPKDTATASEYLTDMRAMDGITKAWEKCKANNYTNCTGYSFIFSLPDNSGFIEGTLQDKNKNPKMKL